MDESTRFARTREELTSAALRFEQSVGWPGRRRGLSWKRRWRVNAALTKAYNPDTTLRNEHHGVRTSADSCSTRRARSGKRGRGRRRRRSLGSGASSGRNGLKVPPALCGAAKASSPPIAKCNTRRTWPVGFSVCKPLWMLLLNSLGRPA